MTLEVHCEVCRKSLEQPGGLLFTVPSNLGYVLKIHLCALCTERVLIFISEIKDRGP